MVSTVSKLHQISPAALSSVDFFIWVTVWGLVLTAGVNVIILNARRPKEQKLMAIVSCTGSICQLAGAKTIDAGMLYPMTTGGSIVIMTVFGRVLYKEKMEIRKVLGVVMAVAATVLFAF